MTRINQKAIFFIRTIRVIRGYSNASIPARLFFLRRPARLVGEHLLETGERF